MDKQKILIIDDDEDILETVGALLSHEGYEIHSADTVEKGKAMIDEVSPDLVLLDVMFPEKKTRGFEAAGEIKEKNPELPIFVFTAINREYAFDFNKDDICAEEFINKPVETDKLVALIKNYI
ncbi:MAG: response regulator [Spirochaetales bacterium]|nr:response regulator [Spirochaetales bacterium]